MAIQEIAADRRDRPNPSFSANLVGVFAWMGKIVILCRGTPLRKSARNACALLRPLGPEVVRGAFPRLGDVD